jgi:voltage-gated potassium channel
MESKRANVLITQFQIVVLALSIYSLIAVFVLEILKPSIAVAQLLNIFDFVVCVIFLIDFIHQMTISKNRLRYFFHWGWIDLISSIPVIGFFRWGRLVRTVRLLRMIKSLRILIQFVFKDKASGTLVMAGLIAFILLIVSSTIILSIETTSQSHIKTSIDALLWAFSSMSSSAIAGDAYPVTPAGKILSIILLISGMSLFGTFTAFMAGLFIGPSQKTEVEDIKEILAELKYLRKAREDEQNSSTRSINS